MRRMAARALGRGFFATASPTTRAAPWTTASTRVAASASWRRGRAGDLNLGGVGATATETRWRRRRGRRSRHRGASFASSSATTTDTDPRPALPPPTTEDVRVATMRWLDDVVIGENLCPFARAPRSTPGAIRCVVAEATTIDALFETFREEATALAGTYTAADEKYVDEEEEEEEASPGASDAKSLSEPSTTLVVTPRLDALDDDFVLFLAVVEECEAILESSGLSRRVQLASFHPNYYFEGEEPADPGSYTNRSPYPAIHLLRTVDVSRAIDAHPDTEAIPAANVERLREVGRKTLYETLAALRAFRSR
jgi:uncharacterized protein